MAVYLSGDEVSTRLSAQLSALRALQRQRRAIERQAEAMESEGQTASTIQTTINALLTDWGALRDQIVTELSALPILWQARVKIGMPALYDSANIEAANQSHLGAGSAPSALIRSNNTMELTKSAGPFHVFLQDDIVSISAAEDADNKVTGIKVVYNTAYGGRDLISNGGFASSSSWTESGDSGTEVVITGGQAVFTAATATLSQAKADMYNAGVSNSSSMGWDAILYLVTFTLSSVSAGTLSVGTNASAAQHTVTASATHRALIVGDGHANGLVFTATGFTGNLDDVSMIPFSGLALNAPLDTDNSQDTKLVITLQER
jgi:hypothetical protein